jgi:D-beta-D-heptose 7-phosphate kinase/D-beta-D-heptose 1-phosphate adenosyltransferase
LRFDKFHFLEKARGAKCLIVGDIILDRYLYGDVTRISPEAPIPIVKVAKKSDALGGAANVAGNVRGLCVDVELFGVIGDDPNGQTVLRLLAEKGIKFTGRLYDSTTCKTRVIGMSQQILRIDEEESRDISAEYAAKLMNDIKASMTDARSVIISDYGKGVCTPWLCSEVIKASKNAGIQVIVDPKAKNWKKYAGADIITPNFREFCAVQHRDIENEETRITRFAKNLIAKYDLGALLVTRSEKGMLYISTCGETLSYAATAQEVFDVSGAGDTVVATVAAFLAVGFNAWSAVEIANAAAGIVVGKLGTYPISLDEVASSLDRRGMEIEGKIVLIETLIPLVEKWRNAGEKIVFTNGCFDILHAGHVYYLKKASDLGNRLIIGLNSDSSVKRLKGETRPVNRQENRALLLSALKFVDAVTLFDEDTPANLIKSIAPDILVQGGDYRPEEVVGREFAGELVLIPYLDGFSSTGIIDKIKQ